MEKLQLCFRKKITRGNGARLRVRVVAFAILLMGAAACGPERRQDLQDSGKVSVSDSTHNAKSGDKGVGSAGAGYAKEGQGDAVTGTDSVATGTSAENAAPKTDTASKNNK
jgi:hypothetical protein